MGKIHIYCGDGKGKTTASIGLTIRALGSGYKVIFAQFLKSSKTGELEIFNKLDNIEIYRGKKANKFTFQMNKEELAECKKENDELFNCLISKKFDEKTLLVLDESVGTIASGLLDKNLVLDFLRSKPECEIVLTGRNPTEELVELADYVSCIEKVKHPFDCGVNARKGIEF